MADKKRRMLNEHLSEEIMEEILYKLPIKSLLRFKCVSKSWPSIISSKAFIKEHLKRSIAKDESSGLADLTHHKLLFTYRYTDQNRNSFFSLGSSSLGNKPNTTLYDTPMPKVGFLILGSCNGMILIRFYMKTGPVILWNPSTRKYQVIPPPSFDPVPLEFSLRKSSCDFVYGLGYDESNDEYKVVCIRDSSLREPFHYQTQMYSLKTYSWKKIESFSKRFLGIYPGTFLNGRLHWLSRFDSISTRNCCDIVSFDLAEEKYQTFSHRTDYFRAASVQVVGEYLGLTILNLHPNVDVWVMKEYGVRESWTKVWTLSDFVDDTLAHLRSGITSPLCWRKNGDIVVFSGHDVFVCNGKNILMRKSRVGMPDRICNSIVYVESLVSPFIDEH